MISVAHLFNILCCVIFVLSLYAACAAFIGEPVNRAHLSREEQENEIAHAVGFGALASVSLWLAILTSSW